MGPQPLLRPNPLPTNKKAVFTDEQLKSSLYLMRLSKGSFDCTKIKEIIFEKYAKMYFFRKYFTKLWQGSRPFKTPLSFLYDT